MDRTRVVYPRLLSMLRRKKKPEDGDAVLAVDDEADDLNALHDSGEVIEPLLKRRGASIRARREHANGILMKRKSGGVVVAHRIDILLNHLYHVFAHDVSYPSREVYFDRLDRGSKATAAFIAT